MDGNVCVHSGGVLSRRISSRLHAVIFGLGPRARILKVFCRERGRGDGRCCVLSPYCCCYVVGVWLGKGIVVQNAFNLVDKACQALIAIHLLFFFKATVILSLC